MTDLLHSKKFRTNLYKWLLSYTGVMLLLTNVITYSKYISKFELKDNARIAKFNVEITSIDTCLDEKEISCNIGSFRPTSEIEYNFKVQTDFEVKTEMTVSIFVNSDFKIQSVVDGAGNLITSCQDKTTCSTPIQTMSPGTKTETYKVIIKYAGEETQDGNYTTEKEYAEVVRIGYSASQVTKEG